VQIVAISADQADRAPDVPVPAVIHHGIDVARYPVGDGDGDTNGPYFCFLGRMAPEKGLRQAIVAARRARVRLLIAAKMREPAERAYFDGTIRPLLGDGIVYVGEVGFAAKVRLLGAARALLNPIRWPEPFGLVMVEALACGTPVIARPVGSAAELLDAPGTGRLAEDDDELVECILHADEFDRAACARVARTRFARAVMVQRHIELYRRIVTDQSNAVVSGERVRWTSSNAPLPVIST
jgi:glycosyltransferase involved in cell wall biosynthesis